MDERYQGKPLLRIAELYVIDSIRALTLEHELLLKAMTPELAKSYKVEGDWRAVVEKVLGLKEDTPEVIRKTWKEAQDLSEEHGADLSVENFASFFIDQNFSLKEDEVVKLPDGYPAG